MTTNETIDHAGFPPGTVYDVASGAQRGLWLAGQRDPSSPAYLMPYAFEVEGTLEPAALEQALRALVDRHQTLRTAFLLRGTTLFQAILPDTGQISQAGPAGIDIEAALAREQSTPFDLAAPPFVRVRIWPIGPERHVVAFTFHHIAMDGRSVEVFWRELEIHYAAAVAGRPVRLPELPLSYADYAAWEADWLGTEDYRRRLDARVERLRVASAHIDLPEAGSASAGEPWWKGGHRVFRLGRSDTRELARLAAEYDCTPFAVLLLVYSGLIHRWSGHGGVAIGVPTALRDLPGLENVVGMFVNTVPVVLDWGDDPSTVEALRRCRIAVAEALDSRRVPFDRIAAALPGARRSGTGSVVAAVFAYEDGRDAGPAGLVLAGTRARSLRGPEGVAKFELSLDCVFDGTEVDCRLEWSTRCWDPALADLFIVHFTAIVRHIAVRPADRVGRWPMADPSAPRDLDWFEAEDVLSDSRWTAWCAGRPVDR